MNFSAYAAQFEESVLPLKKPASQATMRSHLKLINSSPVGALPLEALDPAAVQRFITSLAASLQPRSVKNVYRTLHLVLAQALAEGRLERLPKPVLPKNRRSDPEWLSADEMRRIIASAGELRLFCALLAETGLRIGEAIGLMPADFNSAARTLTVRRSIWNGRAQDPKTFNAFRTLTLSEWLSEMLAPVAVGEAFVFRTSKGTPWWPGEVLPEKIAAYRLGHAAPGLTLGTYAQPFEGMDRDWADKIAEVLK